MKENVMTLNYEDDPGAPGEGLYTAEEKRARDRNAGLILKTLIVLTVGAFAVAAWLATC